MRWLQGSVVLLILLTLGCAGAMTSHGGAGQGQDSSRPAPSGGASSETTSSLQARPEKMPTAPTLTLTALGNAMYPCEQVSGGMVQLSDGKYSEDVGSASANQLHVTLSDKMAYGDLDDDGNNDAALILIADEGTQGTFYNLEAVVNANGIVDPRASVVLGDRVRINSVIILSGEILVDLRRRGPHDSPNMPTVKFKESYRLRGRELELLESKQYQ